MNILIIKDKEDTYIDNFVENVENHYKENQDNYNVSVKFIKDTKSRAKIDQVVVFSNSISFIEEVYYKYSNKTLVSIVTNNFDAKHVLWCLILTENLPTVKGVIVVSSGANDIGIKLDILNAVSTLLDISTDKISVLKGI